MHRITQAWLEEWRVPNGGWTRAQLDALGVSSPPRVGWRTRIEGQLISHAQATAFEAGRNTFTPQTLRRKAKQDRRNSPWAWGFE